MTDRDPFHSWLIAPSTGPRLDRVRDEFRQIDAAEARRQRRAELDAIYEAGIARWFARQETV